LGLLTKRGTGNCSRKGRRKAEAGILFGEGKKRSQAKELPVYREENRTGSSYYTHDLVKGGTVKRIIIVITNEGEFKIETKGFTAKACLEESRFLKDLPGRETARQLTPVYYTKANQKEVIRKHLPLCG
jgi:hypothetical protein